MIHRAPILFLLVSLLCLVLIPVFALHADPPVRVDRDLEHLFDRHGVTGAFAMRNIDTGEMLVVFPTRIEERRIPASTFKIANSLIALETGAVGDVDEIIPFGGKPQPIKAWERDMPMREAIAVSNVPIYQELARRIGLEAYADWLARLQYGNRQTGDNLERFWLDGPLAISPLEQINFLTRLIRDALPASVEHQQTVRDLIFLESNDRGSLYGKTGWSVASDPQIGWWVGWVERDDTAYVFALTIDMASRADAGKREALGRDLLQALNVY